MKILFVIFVSVFALLLGSCAEQPLMSDEEYDAHHPPAPYSPDPMTHMQSQESSRPGGY